MEDSNETRETEPVKSANKNSPSTLSVEVFPALPEETTYKGLSCGSSLARHFWFSVGPIITTPFASRPKTVLKSQQALMGEI